MSDFAKLRCTFHVDENDCNYMRHNDSPFAFRYTPYQGASACFSLYIYNKEHNTYDFICSGYESVDGVRMVIERRAKELHVLKEMGLNVGS